MGVSFTPPSLSEDHTPFYTIGDIRCHALYLAEAATGTAGGMDGPVC